MGGVNLMPNQIFKIMCSIQRKQYLDAVADMGNRGLVRETWFPTEEEEYQKWLYYSRKTNKNFRDDATFYINQIAIILVGQWEYCAFAKRRVSELLDGLYR